MAGETLSPFLFTLLFLISMPYGLRSGYIATYWGQDDYEGSLLEACSTNNYKFVNLAFLSQFGNNQTMKLNLGRHCTNDSSCRELTNDIKSCQSRGVKVLLSIGGRNGNYGLSSLEEARQVADDTWNNFLVGTNSTSRPFGDATLDGIDFYIEGEKTGTKFWDVLANRLMELSKFQMNLILTAAPQCTYPNPWLDTALRIPRLFDSVWVRFYNDESCEYRDNADNMKKSWRRWTTGTNATWIYLGLPAADDAAESGYVVPHKAISEVLPAVKSSVKYGGVMLWSWPYDHGYSSIVKNYV